MLHASPKFLYFKAENKDRVRHNDVMGKEPAYWGGGGSSTEGHLSGVVARDAVADSKPFAVYQLVGHVTTEETADTIVPFAVGQKVKNRDGLDARILAVDLKGSQPIVAAVRDVCGARENVGEFDSDGSFFCNDKSSQDLIPNTIPGGPRRAVFETV